MFIFGIRSLDKLILDIVHTLLIESFYCNNDKRLALCHGNVSYTLYELFLFYTCMEALMIV